MCRGTRGLGGGLFAEGWVVAAVLIGAARVTKADDQLPKMTLHQILEKHKNFFYFVRVKLSLTEGTNIRRTM